MVFPLIALFLTLCAILKPRSQIVTSAVFLLMWLLFGWNNWNGDYEAYEIIYYESITTLKLLLDERNFYEIGFICLNAFFRFLKFEFQEFLIFYSLIPLFLLFHFIRNQSSVPAAVSAIFFWFFFPLDYVLMRNFLSFTIFLFAVSYILINLRPSSTKYVTIICVACLFHASSAFYFAYTVILKQKGASNNGRPIAVVLFITLGYVLFKLAGGDDIVDRVSQGRREFYDSSLKTVISLGAIQTFFLFTVIYAHLQLKSYYLNEKSLIFSQLIISFNIINLGLIAVYVDYAILVRLFRHACFLNCILLLEVAYVLSKRNISKVSVKVLAIYTILFILLLFCYLYFIYPVTDLTLLPLFYANLLSL